MSRLRKIPEMLIRVACLQAKIQICNLLNMKLGVLPTWPQCSASFISFITLLVVTYSQYHKMPVQHNRKIAIYSAVSLSLNLIWPVNAWTALPISWDLQYISYYIYLRWVNILLWMIVPYFAKCLRPSKFLKCFVSDTYSGMSGLNVGQNVCCLWLNIRGSPQSISASTRLVMWLNYKIFQISSN
jgi:hypothetical protein